VFAVLKHDRLINGTEKQALTNRLILFVLPAAVLSADGVVDIATDLLHRGGALRRSAHFAAKDAEVPPAGLEPATCGLGNRCSIP
jgi:hypothetical protein